jgi:YD repeat-containing protein
MAPNGGQQAWSYDGAGRITGTTWISGTTSLFTQTVTLDGAGQRTASNDSWGSTTYGYDTAGRLTSASYPDGSSEADQYDAGGNRTVMYTAPQSGPS